VLFQCTATCGSDIQTRDVICIKKLDKRLFAVVGSENCKEHRKPNTKQDCPEQRACPAEWFTTKWSQVGWAAKDTVHEGHFLAL